MQREAITVTPDDTLATALKLTRKHRIRHLPVVLANGDLAGILSDRDIRLAMPSPLTTPDAERTDFLEATAIAGIMAREVIAIGPDETIEAAAKLLTQHRIGALPVIDFTSQRLLGILTETDILHALVRLFGVGEPSSRIEILLQDRPGELGRALSVIGQTKGVNVVSLVVPSYREAEGKTALVNLGTIDPRDVVEALREAGYPTGWPALTRDEKNVIEAPAGG